MNDSCINISLCDYHFCNEKNKCLYVRSNPHKRKVIEIKILKNKYPKRVASLIQLGAEGFCLCCEKSNNLTFDHIIPLSKGGSNKLENGQILCYSCNILKGDSIITIEQLKNKLNISLS